MNATRYLAPALFAAFCIGCFNPDVKKEEKSPKKGDGEAKVALGNQFGLGGDLDDLARRRAAQNPKAQPINRGQIQERRVAASGGNVGVTTDRVYNLREIMKLRPDLKVMNKSTTGSFVTNTYYAAVSQASVSFFKHDMDLFKAQHERYPTYQEYITKKKRFNLKMAKLPPWQVWAYDEKTGELKVLEDPKKKTEIEGN